MSDPSNTSLPLSNCSEPTEVEIKTLTNVNVIVGGYGSILLAILGICANALAITVFWRKKLKSIFTNLLIALAVFDLALAWEM